MACRRCATARPPTCRSPEVIRCLRRCSAIPQASCRSPACGRTRKWAARSRQTSCTRPHGRPTGAAAATAARTAITAGAGAECRLRLHWQQAFALQLLARQLAGAAHGFRLFAGLLLGGLLVMTAELHLAENPLALHLLLQRLEGLIDVVIADENLHAASSFRCERSENPGSERSAKRRTFS